MPIIRVPEQALESKAYERLVPGSRVEYRGTSWKVVGMYFAAAQHRPDSAAAERTKYVILQSLRLAPGALQYLGALHSS
jgi:hypothetical protein